MSKVEQTKIEQTLEQRLAVHLTELVEMTGETRTVIAERCGFKRPNILSMILNGQTRLPIDKIHPFARTVGADPNHLSRLCLETYEPAIFKVVQSMLNAAKDSITPAEWQIIRAIRKAKGDQDLTVSQTQLKAVADIFTS